MAKSAAGSSSSRPSVVSAVLGRSRSLFADDLAARSRELKVAIAGRRFLVAGAAGSIGSAFVEQILHYEPAALHLVDPNENALVEVVRDLRTSRRPAPPDFRTFSIAIGSEEFDAFLAAAPRYDSFVNFAAMKHVRSERDAFSLMRMIDINVRALADILQRLPALGVTSAFSVSSDKAVRPVSLMGATKALMEKTLAASPGSIVATTARFANVAFSAGSLLEGFVKRLAKQQPLAGPSDISRYFISHEEAGQLCLLAACLGQDRDILFPKLDKTQLRPFPEIAEAFLAWHGFKARFYQSASDAVAAVPGDGQWPCYFSPSNTSGEKPYEEFSDPQEKIDASAFEAIDVVRGQAVAHGEIDAFLEEARALRSRPRWDRADIVALLGRHVSSLQRDEFNADLDQKM